MYNYKIVEQVIRKPKPLTGVLRTVMLIFAVILLLLGIILSQGFMLPGFLFHQRLDLMLLAFRFQQCLDLLMRVDNIADRKIVVERGDKVGNVF